MVYYFKVLSKFTTGNIDNFTTKFITVEGETNLMAAEKVIKECSKNIFSLTQPSIHRLSESRESSWYSLKKYDSKGNFDENSWEDILIKSDKTLINTYFPSAIRVTIKKERGSKLG